MLRDYILLTITGWPAPCFTEHPENCIFYLKVILIITIFGYVDAYVTETYGNYSIPQSSTVIIQCGFDVPVDCVWELQGTNMEIYDRYTYVLNDGKNTQDCAIQIIDFNSKDVGNWECKSAADSYSNGMLSTSVWLGLEGQFRKFVNTSH